MRANFVRDLYGKIIHERDNEWPDILAEISPNERVIYAAGGQRLVLQYRHRNQWSGEWGKWVRIATVRSHGEMRKLLEPFHPFASDFEKLDAICLNADEGDYVEHSH